MKIEIFDVEHGQCAMIHCPNGKKLMIDAGHNGSKPWFPSLHFFGQDIEKLVITNYDQDHTSDLVDLRAQCNVKAITANRSITSQNLASMKAEFGMSNGIKNVHEWLQWLERQPGGNAPVSVDLGGVLTTHYWNQYGVYDGQFTDANNLSVATFVSYGNFCILYPGDLEVAGWKQLLKNPSFQNDLRRVTVLVASHHGRENGCCDEVFTYASPKAVIISDAGKQHASQETRGWYGNRVPGYQEADGTTRKVLTTCYDGTITINVDTNGMGHVTTEKQRNTLSPAY